MAQRKETKIKIKVHDLKPKKDAKGGRYIGPDQIPSGPGKGVTGPGGGGNTDIRG